MATPHIGCEKEDIAKTVLMPGDPLRAKMIAEKFLDNARCVNEVRGMLAYTGTYKGHEVTVFASGMGCPSIGIYSYELFNFYDVENIIRVGSCGSFKEDLGLYEVLLVDKSYAESNFLKELTGEDDKVLSGSSELNNKLENAALRCGIKINKGNVFCTDVFYNNADIDDLRDNYNCYATEMESFGLFSNARKLNKNAAVILTVSDNLITREKTTSEERQNSFNKMIEIALESIL